MTDLATDQTEKAVEPERSEAVPVLITFALLFLLSAAVWFILDRIRADEVRTTETSQGAVHGQGQVSKVQPNRVANAK